MAIFNRNDKVADTDYSTKELTKVSQGTSFTGDVVSECNLLIDGEINGNILSKASVTIGAKGKVEGKIAASKIIISGFFKGELEGETVELSSTSNVIGDIISDKLVIEDGGNFEGYSKKRKSNEYLSMKEDEEEKVNSYDDKEEDE
ncbi:polymer-forming cytoskeletal protein [Fusobacterium sp.]|uniref:bactofilin family protein n=1 Tax=Fusobacterium sp. TaxID=68766 RepID=UPI0028FE8FFE|nr:polymer-forming cytoskeletal protein [Fusobacterium sp.]MDU1911430.1 polymer-forming cytoskeletal protein [Fusobacterium sp.]